MRAMSVRLPCRRVQVAIAAACLVLATAVVAVEIRGRGDASASPVRGTPPPTAEVAARSVTHDETERSAPVGQGIELSATSDVYAAAVGALVFEVDTRRSTPAQLREQLRSDADPLLSADGRRDLYATIDARVPADDLWERMHANAQWSRWEPTRTWEPAAWAEVVTTGQAEPGWVMRNVSGLQTTYYVEDGQERSTSREATLSVVMRCPAAGVHPPSCRLVLIATQPVF